MTLEGRKVLLGLQLGSRESYEDWLDLARDLTARCLEDELEALIVHLRFPSEHRKRIRSTNLLERTFVEVRRRTKVIGRFPGETSALTVIWAVLELSSRGWRGVEMTPKTVAQLERIRRRAANDEENQPSTKEVVAASNRVQAELRRNGFTAGWNAIA